MKTIHIVYYDWAYNGGSDEGILGCYESEEDAIEKLNQYWQEQVDEGYLEGLNEQNCSEKRKECWKEGWYDEWHNCVQIMVRYLFSREDVANGLA